MPIAVIYCRVSSERQVREGHGLDGQELRCRQYAQLKGYEVVETFRDEGVSGGVVDREGIRAMLDFVRSSQVRPVVVIIDDLKRLSRDLMGHFELRKSIQRAGGQLESPSHQFGEAPEDVFVESVLAATAELERNQNRRQVKNRMKSRLESGYWVFYPPPGYRFETVPRHGRMLVPDPKLAPVVREMFSGYASGRFANRGQIALYLESVGFLARQDKPAQAIYHELVTRILTNEMYTGVIAYQKWGITPRQAHHEPLVDPSTFRLVQSRLSEQLNSPCQANIADDFPLRGIVACSRCNGLLTASWVKGRRNRYAYYRCYARTCPKNKTSFPAQKLHDGFRVVLLNSVPDPQGLARIRTLFERQWKQRLDQIEAKRQEEQKKYREIEDRIEQFLQTMTTTTSVTVQRRLEQEIEKLELAKCQLNANARERSSFNLEEALEHLLDSLKNTREQWDSGDLATRKLILKLVFRDSICYDEKSGFGTASLSQVLAIYQQSEGDESRMVDLMGGYWNRIVEELIAHLRRLQGDGFGFGEQECA